VYLLSNNIYAEHEKYVVLVIIQTNALDRLKAEGESGLVTTNNKYYLGATIGVALSVLHERLISVVYLSDSFDSPSRHQ
jgi:hypothetical protein